MTRKILALLALTALIAGCRSTAKEDVEKHNIAKIEASEAAKLKKSIDTYAVEMIDGMKKHDYKLFVKYLLPSIRKQRFSEKVFKAFYTQVEKNLGVCESHEFLTCLDQPPLKVFLYKCKFGRTVKKDGKTKEFKRDVIYRLTIAKVDGNFQIIAFSFQ